MSHPQELSSISACISATFSICLSEPKYQENVSTFYIFLRSISRQAASIEYRPYAHMNTIDTMLIPFENLQSFMLIGCL